MAQARMFNREKIVAAVASLMLVFTGWAWGGVVLWTQFVTCGLGALALLLALMPQDPRASFWPRLRRGFLVSFALALAAATALGLIDWLEFSKQRNATLQLIPDAVLPEVALADWGLRGVGAGVALSVAGMFATVLGIPTGARASLVRFPPFWIGAALFGYIAVQALNPWGLVVERDLTWNIVPLDPASWLPAGLAAPFIGDNDPGGMNAWRQMLILSGPWMLLCALRIAVQRRRTLAALAWIVGLNSLAVGIVGAVVAAGKDFSFMGFKSWYAYRAPFGPFIYKNHAGIYLYLSAALMLALTVHLIARKGDRADRGGPHLLAGLVFVMLCVVAGCTLSIGAIVSAGALLLLAPCLYFLDRNVRAALSPAPAIMMLVAGLVVAYAAIASSDLYFLRSKLDRKLTYVERSGTDDRAPIRRAVFAQLEAGGPGKLMAGWGAGSYRWTAPPYLAKQPEYVDSKGRLWKRPNFAHCDWLQALLEWGVVGCVPIAVALGWLLLRFRNAWRRRSATLLALSAGVGMALIHASIDFIFYFMPVLTLVALMTAWLASAPDGESAEC